MFKFLHIFKPQSQVTQAKDNVIFEDSTQYLYFDVEENSEVTRKVIKSPTAASEVSYGNSNVATALNGKVDAVSGKGLSTEDYTTADQTKLSGIETGAEVNTIETVKVNGTTLTPDANRAVNVTVPSTFDASAVTSGTFDIARIPAAALERCVHVANRAARLALTTDDVQLGDTVKQEDTGVMYFVINILALDSDLGYEEFVAGNAATVNSHTVNSDVPANAVFTDTTYESKTAASGGTDVSLVTTGEKYTWNNKQNALTFDSTPTASSTNPATSGGIYTALGLKVDAVSGKGLSTNDYDATAKNKLDGLANIKSVGTGLNLNSSTGELTASGIPAGGTAGQMLIKDSSTDGDASWQSLDSSPTQNSTKPATSGGIYTALSSKTTITTTTTDPGEGVPLATNNIIVVVEE